MRRRDPWPLIGLVAFLGLVFLALFGERIAPNEPIYFLVEHGRDERPYDPGRVFPFGSDVLGRDLFSLVLAGARATLTIVLLAGAARVAAGVLVAAIGTSSRPMRLLTDLAAEIVGAVPATLVALVLVRALVKTDATATTLIAALLVVGWAGPYRVLRAELDRVAAAPFTEGALAIGVSRWRLFWRHHLPHLTPVMAMNASQQIVASLVLVAELGVIGVLVGAVRSIDIQESLSVIRVGPPSDASIPDTPEWGALLATSRTVDALWWSRWLIFVPGAAFAVTAVAVTAIGYGFARRYSQHDVFRDLRKAAIVPALLLAMFVISALAPERYADAREWADASRSELQPVESVREAFERAGLATRSVTQDIKSVERSGPATVSIGGNTVREAFPRPNDPPVGFTHMQSVVSADVGGGGRVTAPLVFAARGIVPAELPRRPFYRPPRGPDLAELVKDYPNDYADLEVRGKVVLLVRFLGVDAGAAGYAIGPAPDIVIERAIERGAAAVLFVDPELSSYTSTANPYLVVERSSPPTRTTGVPVVVLDEAAAERLVRPLGLDLSSLLGYDPIGAVWHRSLSRDVDAPVDVDVPVSERTLAVTSVVARVPGIDASTGHIVLWAARGSEANAIDQPRSDVIAAVARLAASRHAPFVFVDADRRADPKIIRGAFDDARVALVLVLEQLRGDVLTFESANGDLIPALDFYAQKVGARYEVTRQTASIARMAAPLPFTKTVAMGATGGTGDARSDVVAVVGYLAGRHALRAPELPR
jgi:peptide/nickel transport system permease protein